ncbi:DNA mismatch repair protein MutS [Zobellella denitrificans]|jgi:DNA-nicking Smr family endonuclease|uniref:DNA mismatch repair protein MutS n=1 Tax=Zobellella denitrificans TaxID=347534 RepID=A0A291HLS2_9GAMM|nr:DNA endonuclease SmrA [Zobellella denitrificans]ATG73166.1 DNA mismatch repair protein MutS [Zobellella denitrificans]
MPSSEWSSFIGELEGLTPLRQDTLASVARPGQDAASLETRRAAAEAEQRAAPACLSLENVTLLKPDDLVSYKKDGVQEGVFRKLRLGKYPCEARLDLHNHTVAQARAALLGFIRDCLRLELRSVVVVHGKGERSRPQALLKSYVSGWLPQLPEVLACHSTQRAHGGSGSLYVLLRKSERAKQETRERHQSRLG